MLRIRLTRVGKKNEPYYRLVVTEKSAPVKGRYIEILGSYNPRSKNIKLNQDKIENWLKKGAKPSITANNLLVKGGVLKKKDIIKITVKAKKKKSDKGKEETKEKFPQEAKPKTKTGEKRKEKKRNKTKKSTEKKKST